MVQQTLHRFDIDMAPLAGPAELSLGATNSGRSMMSQDSVLQPSDGRNSIVFSINQSAASATSNSLANSANQISSTAADPSERREIDFERLGHLGHGQFGDVAHVRDKHSPHHEFALKRSLRPFISERARVRFMNEMSYVHQCSPHPNIVRHISAWQENGHAYVQMELCRSGTLYAALKSGVLDRYSSMWLLLHDMASALSVIHAHRLVHMDIKPTNIYVDTNGASPVFKLGDFGLCCLEHNAIDDGDKLYLAPEFFRSLRDACSTAADIFSLGTTLYELYCQFDERLPSTGAEYQALRSDHIVFPEHIPDLPGVDVDAFSALSFRQIIQCMMSSEPANRPTAVQLMQHQCCKEALALARPAEVDTLPASSSDTHVLSPTPAARVASVVGSEVRSCIGCLIIIIFLFLLMLICVVPESKLPQTIPLLIHHTTQIKANVFCFFFEFSVSGVSHNKFHLCSRSAVSDLFFIALVAACTLLQPAIFILSFVGWFPT
jgi:serine/threonine protein kinase